MASDGIRLLDVVALRHDIPERGLREGHVGTVVEKLDDDVYEVEFSDDLGRAFAMAPLNAAQLMVLRYEPVEKEASG